ncbi:lysosomal alpha-glucosidase-like [Tubulanus polymorphus]|uniref:lysosomal alpha-glucosidase-like n=1 Tax=Tubulanus polymorphus TaxID=672921 RepID=UPI003DA45FC5
MTVPKGMSNDCATGRKQQKDEKCVSSSAEGGLNGAMTLSEEGSKNLQPKIRIDANQPRLGILVAVVVAFMMIIGISAILYVVLHKPKVKVYPMYIPESRRQLWHPDLPKPYPKLENKQDPISCKMSQRSRLDCYPGGGATADKCRALGCCWSPVSWARNRYNRYPKYQRYQYRRRSYDDLIDYGGSYGIPFCFFRATPSPQPRCSAVRDAQRIDCHPEYGVTPDKCLSRGCCWWGSNTTGTPWCFYPQQEGSGYRLDSLTRPTPYSYAAEISRQLPSRWPNDIAKLRIDVYYETNERLHLKITDPANKRYEVPIVTPPTSYTGTTPKYNVTFQKVGTTLKLDVRRTDAVSSVLLTVTGDKLTYSDQFIELSTPSASRYLYGLGEHRSAFAHDTKVAQTFSFWSRDVGPTPHNNLYGVHPFFIGRDLTNNGSRYYGVFLLNSNAMDFIISPSATNSTPSELTYRTIGGILDFYLFLGPTPDSVVQQYSDVIGRPAMPPHWSLGFHLCRWGYDGGDGLQKVIARMREGKFPYDTQWNDIDYMEGNTDWTYDTLNYASLPAIVDDLHKHGQHYVIIVDPAIKYQTGYKPYEDGIALDVFIKNPWEGSSAPLIGKVWPGNTVFPDFTHPNATRYWTKQAKEFYQKIKFDGIWIDMNEPSSFVDGSVVGCPKKFRSNPYDYPPYTPRILGGSLKAKTICASAKQHLSLHYNIHSLYGYHEAVVTNRMLPSITGQRPFLLSRSTFAGSGQYTAHWTGDNRATWNDLSASIPAMMNFNMFGIPFVGADICGFNGATNQELCVRWMQLGVFYPFMRNHNSFGLPDQDPASPLFNKTSQDYMRSALLLRYKLIPYLYTQLYQSNATGAGIFTPMFFQYPSDENTFTLDEQFMFGPALMVSPVLHPNRYYVQTYFPNDTWFDFYNGTAVRTLGHVTLRAGMDRINVHVRGGSIIPYKQPEVTTTLMAQNAYKLLVALPMEDGRIFTGHVYSDDGVSLQPNGGGNLVTIRATKHSNGGGVTLIIDGSSCASSANMKLEEITIYGLRSNCTLMQTLHPDRFASEVPGRIEYNEGVVTMSGLREDLCRNDILVCYSRDQPLPETVQIIKNSLAIAGGRDFLKNRRS